MDKEKAFLILNENSHSYNFELRDANDKTLYKLMFSKTSTRNIKKALINKLIKMFKTNGITRVSIIFYGYNKIFIRNIVKMLGKENINILEFKGKRPIDEEIENIN